MTTALLIMFGVLFAVCVICLLTGCAVAIADCFRKDSADEWLENQLAARRAALRAALRAAHRAAARKILPLVFLTVLFGKCAAWSAEATPPLASSGNPPTGTAEWLGIAAFIIATAVGLGNLIQMIRGTKLQQPITVAGQEKFATASAFSNHCDEQKKDLLRIEGHAAECTEALRKEVHQIDGMVRDMNGRSEQRAEQLNRLEDMMREVLMRTQSTPRPR